MSSTMNCKSRLMVVSAFNGFSFYKENTTDYVRPSKGANETVQLNRQKRVSNLLPNSVESSCIRRYKLNTDTSVSKDRLRDPALQLTMRDHATYSLTF